MVNELILSLTFIYFLAGLLQGIIISIYENWNDGFGAPGESIIGIILIMYGWPLFHMINFIEWYKEKSV